MAGIVYPQTLQDSSAMGFPALSHSGCLDWLRLRLDSSVLDSSILDLRFLDLRFLDLRFLDSSILDWMILALLNPRWGPLRPVRSVRSRM
jgi:hypothetical protein